MHKCHNVKPYKIFLSSPIKSLVESFGCGENIDDIIDDVSDLRRIQNLADPYECVEGNFHSVTHTNTTILTAGSILTRQDHFVPQQSPV
jgi:hypothetical protein